MFYEGYHIWGMHLVWWMVWLFLITWLFAKPYGATDIRNRRNSAMEILKRRFASGDITVEEFQKKKIILEGTGENPASVNPD